MVQANTGQSPSPSLPPLPQRHSVGEHQATPRAWQTKPWQRPHSHTHDAQNAAIFLRALVTEAVGQSVLGTFTSCSNPIGVSILESCCDRILSATASSLPTPKRKVVRWQLLLLLLVLYARWCTCLVVASQCTPGTWSCWFRGTKADSAKQSLTHSALHLICIRSSTPTEFTQPNVITYSCLNLQLTPESFCLLWEKKGALYFDWTHCNASPNSKKHSDSAPKIISLMAHSN